MMFILRPVGSSQESDPSDNTNFNFASVVGNIFVGGDVSTRFC